MLRHPVVISTIEEDFQKIGLITEAKTAPEETIETAPEGEEEVAGLEDLDLEDAPEESGVVEVSWLKYQAASDLAEDDDEACRLNRVTWASLSLRTCVLYGSRS